MKLRYAFAPFAIACLAAVFLSGCGKKDSGGGDADGTIATVNGQPISNHAFYDLLMEKRSVYVNGQRGPQAVSTYGSLGLQGLRDMVEQDLILQIAKDEGVSPTDADVDKELAFQNKLRPGYTDTLIKMGMPMDDVRKDTLFQLARDRIITKGVTVPMSEVDQYIKENPGKQFSKPAQDDLLVIEVKTADKKTKVDAALASGKSFKDVASAFSDAPGAKTTGGKIGPVPVAEMAKPVQAALAKTAPQHATDWIAAGPSAFVKFYLVGKVPESPITLTSVQKEDLQRHLALQRGQATNDIEAKLLAKLKTASVDVSNPLLKSQWKQLEDQIKSAPSGPTGSMPTPGGAPPSATPPAGPAATGKPTTTAPSKPRF